MTSVPEYKLFREAEMSYALVCMATDYDSWHETNEGVSVEMVMGHMIANGANAKTAVAAVLETLAQDGSEDIVNARRWRGANRVSDSQLCQKYGKNFDPRKGCYVHDVVPLPMSFLASTRMLANTRESCVGWCHGSRQGAGPGQGCRRR